MRDQEERLENLRRNGTWNRGWRRVTLPMFSPESPFGDPHDVVQVKYELLRAHYVDGLSVTAATRAFGCTRQTYYLAAKEFKKEGLSGLVAKRRGPKGPRKLTAAMLTFIHGLRRKEPRLPATSLAESVKEAFSVSIHPRSIQRHLRQGPRQATLRLAKVSDAEQKSHEKSHELEPALRLPCPQA